MALVLAANALRAPTQLRKFTSKPLRHLSSARLFSSRALTRPSNTPVIARGSMTVRAMSSDMVSMINTKNAENAVMIYSKTYCPYCTEVKSLFSTLKVPAKIIELDDLADGSAVQSALQEVTGRRTVPQVFVGGKHVGGCDDTIAAYKSGSLKTMLSASGIEI